MLRKEAQHTAKQINPTQGNWKQEDRRTERRESWGKEGKGRKAEDYILQGYVLWPTLLTWVSPPNVSTDSALVTSITDVTQHPLTPLTPKKQIEERGLYFGLHFWRAVVSHDQEAKAPGAEGQLDTL